MSGNIHSPFNSLPDEDDLAFTPADIAERGEVPCRPQRHWTRPPMDYYDGVDESLFLEMHE